MTAASTRLSARTHIVSTYRRFRAVCSSIRLGWASVISTGSALRERADSWLEATTPIPPPADHANGTPRGTRLHGPSCHRIRADAGTPGPPSADQAPARAAFAACFCSCLNRRTSTSDSGPVMSATERREPSSPYAPAAFRQPGGVTPYCFPSSATKIFDFCAETGQLTDPLQQRGAVGGVGPERLGAAAVALDQQPA